MLTIPEKFETLDQLADFLEALDTQGNAEGHGFDMLSPYFYSQTKHDCGSAACIGGWVTEVNYAGNSVSKSLEGAMFESFDVPTAHAIAICYPSISMTCDPYGATGKQAAFLLRHYIKTGKVDWPLALSANEVVTC